MSSSIFLVLLAGLTYGNQSELSRFELFKDSTKAKKLFEYSADSGRVLHEPQVIGLKSYFEAEIISGGKKVTPVQVSLLFSEIGFTGSVLGSLPSTQVSMNVSSGGGFVFRLELDATFAERLNPNGGVYSVELLVADNDKNALRIDLGRVSILHDDSRTFYNPLPLIDHVFKSPSSRPNVVVTLMFLGLVLMLPITFFGSGLKYLGVNDFSNSRISIAFFCGVGLFVVLMGLFFFALNLVQTVALALLLAAPMSVVGNKMLCQIRTGGILAF